MGSYITIDDICDAISADTVIALYDDGNVGDIRDEKLIERVERVIARSEAEVNSYLIRAYPKLTFPVVQSPLSAMLLQASLMFAVPYSFQRHPEYVRTYGDDARGGAEAVNNARQFMERLCNGTQYLFDVPANPVPYTVGGVSYASGPVTIIDSPDGTYNGGDF